MIKVGNKVIKTEMISVVEILGESVKLYICGYDNPINVQLTDEIKKELEKCGFEIESQRFNYFKVVLDYEFNFSNIVSRVEDILEHLCNVAKEHIVECHKTKEVFAYSKTKIIYLKTIKNVTKQDLVRTINDNLSMPRASVANFIEEISEEEYIKAIEEME